MLVSPESSSHVGICSLFSGLQVGAVVVGLDYHINYFKIQYGLTCLLENQDCLFLATNTDVSAV